MNIENNFIIDAHAHLGSISRCYLPSVSLGEMIEIMDICKIRLTCFSHTAAVVGHEFEYGHRETLKAIKSYPGRIYGYAVYDPIFPEESLKSVDEYLGKDGFLGIKIHPGCHAYPIDGEKYTPLWEYALPKRIPILCHTWDGTPQTTYPYDIVAPQINAEPKLFHSVLQRYDELIIILGHTGGHYRGHIQAIDVAKKYQNVYVDISGAPIGFGLIEWYVRELEARKVFYGSDLILIDPRAHIGRVLRSRFSTGEKEAILFGNAQTLFNL
jgi:predicted TIM-barrel fold metal-dependent hydrolase